MADEEGLVVVMEFIVRLERMRLLRTLAPLFQSMRELNARGDAERMHDALARVEAIVRRF